MSFTPQTNTEIRVWYNEQVARICTPLNEEWKTQGIPAEKRAYMAWQIRCDVKIKAREMMPDKREVRMAEERDLAVYGNITGPTFEEIVAKIKKGIRNLRETPFMRKSSNDHAELIPA